MTKATWFRQMNLISFEGKCREKKPDLMASKAQFQSPVADSKGAVFQNIYYGSPGDFTNWKMCWQMAPLFWDTIRLLCLDCKKDFCSLTSNRMWLTLCTFCILLQISLGQKGSSIWMSNGPFRRGLFSYQKLAHHFSKWKLETVL